MLATRALLLMFALLAIHGLPGAGIAQSETTATSSEPAAAGRGDQTLEDILARQRGEARPRTPTVETLPAPEALPPEVRDNLATRPPVAITHEVWEGLRFGNVPINPAVPAGPTAAITMQTTGMTWVHFRNEVLPVWGGWILGGMLALLVLFYLVRGRIRLDGQPAGRLVQRFTFIERVAHWTLATSFILLALTGLMTLYGRKFLIDLLGKETFASLAAGGKWIHNNVAWPFMVALVAVFVMWVRHNLPSRVDLQWLARGGGLFVRGVHPPAHKFNAGQKLIFWAVIVLGASISASGIALLFPFELSLFGKTFAVLNATGLPQLLGLGPLPEVLTPYQEMQLSQAWHGIVALVFIAIILAHIYIGSIGMEGAFDAMWEGLVDEEWAREHHALWLEELRAKEAEAQGGAAAPAE